MQSKIVATHDIRISRVPRWFGAETHPLVTEEFDAVPFISRKRSVQNNTGCGDKAEPG